jgi:hypothetical protein
VKATALLTEAYKMLKGRSLQEQNTWATFISDSIFRGYLPQEVPPTGLPLAASQEEPVPKAEGDESSS